MQFAEAQLLNYVSKGNRAIRDVERVWRARGHPHDYVTSVRGMPTARYAPSDQPEQIDGQQVLLGWCRRGVIVFKTLDVSNNEIVYCGISDKGQTDAFLNRLLDPAAEAVARALARRLNELGLGPVNVRLLVRAVRERLQATIRYFLEEAVKKLCEAVVEITAAAVLAEFKRRLLNRYFVELLARKFSNPAGETAPIPVAEGHRLRCGGPRHLRHRQRTRPHPGVLGGGGKSAIRGAPPTPASHARSNRVRDCFDSERLCLGPGPALAAQSSRLGAHASARAWHHGAHDER